MQQRYGKRQKQMELNVKALQAGYEYARAHLPVDSYRLTGIRATEDIRMVLSGNDAITLGALAAGLQYFAGYPITPASDIMENLAKQLPRFGGVLVQMEDEIASICSCVGASFAGCKCMTATSGPGLALMVEGLGLATMDEAPVVVVDVQRGGPSTGLPTKVEQSDLDLAVYGGHGDAPRIVLAPTTVEDLFWGTIDAFNLAEKYQTPVILMSDQHLSHRQEAISVPDLDAVRLVNRLTPTDEDLLDYKRYELTETGVSPQAIPGVHDAPWVATGLEHNEHAHISYVPGIHVKMLDKRAAKVARAASEPRAVVRIGDPTASLGIIGWGSSAGAITEAVTRLSGQGIRAQGLVSRLIFPVPEVRLRSSWTQSMTSSWWS
jgi:2-oxoglutarate ferredoxin oxidoreductase subunit alpha